MPPTPAPEVIEVASTRVACDGGDGAAGHPRVWLQIDPERASSNAATATSATS